MTDEEKALLEVWKVTVDVQKHFNDLSMRVRNIAITVFGALLAAAGYALKDESVVTIFDRSFPLTAWILLAALMCWLAFYLMDLHWYHRLLRGAVRHGETVEAALQHRLPEVGLTKAIDAASPIYGLRASHRLTLFYGLFGLVLLVATLAAFQASTHVVMAVVALVVLGIGSLLVLSRGSTKPGTDWQSR